MREMLFLSPLFCYRTDSLGARANAFLKQVFVFVNEVRPRVVFFFGSFFFSYQAFSASPLFRFGQLNGDLKLFCFTVSTLFRAPK